MANAIKTITDKKNLEAVFNKFFFNRDVFLKTQNGNIKVTFLGYSETLVAFRVPFLKNMAEECLIFIRQKGITIYAQLKHIEKQEDEVYVFEPIRMQIISAERQENRKNLSSESGKVVLSISNIISDPIIQNSLVLNNRKIERVKVDALSEVENLFVRHKIFFCHEGSTDPRMRYFYDNNKPFFVADFNNDPEEKYVTMKKIFMEEIFSKDYYLINRKNLISEVSVPIAYLGMIPYGYVQVNNESIMNDSSLIMIQKLADMVDILMKKNNVFPVSDEKLLVSDISKSGLGIVFRERRFIRFFNEQGYVFFNLVLSVNEKLPMLAIVRNITLMENKIIKVGCEILDMDEKTREKFNQYVEQIS